MNRGELRTKMLGILNRRDITATLANEFINDSIRRIQRTLRIPAQDEVLEYVVGSDFTVIPLPDDLLQIRSITFNETHVLQRAGLQATLSAAQSVGTPMYFSRRGTDLIVGPKPTEGSFIIEYAAEFSPVLSDDDQESFLSQIAPDLIVYGALSYAGDYFLDDRVAGFEARYGQIKSDLEEQYLMDELTGNAVVSTAYALDDGR